MEEFLCPGGTLCPQVGRYRRHVNGAVTPQMTDVIVVSLHMANDAVSLQMDGNDVTEQVWSVGK